MSEEIKKNNFKIKFLSLIKNNFKKIISFLILLIICLFIYLFYTNVQKKNEIKISEQYTEASIQFKQKKVNESKLLFEDIINKDHRFYSPLALYFIIDNNLENEKEKIIKFFDKILKINSIDEENINLIKIKKAIFLFSIEDEESIIKTLNPVINSDSVWSKMATELISNYFLSKNQKTKAKENNQLQNNKKNK